MNVKAERIEQMIQVINRNLQLIFSGQVEGITPLEIRQLQRVDAVIFGHDKFAFEMVHFVKASIEQGTRSKNLSDFWEFNFVQGLESLLVECAVVNDDIERDCFVSRVYCWFTEKLSERRDLPRRTPKLENLKTSIEKLGGNPAHYASGIESSIRNTTNLNQSDPNTTTTVIPSLDLNGADTNELPQLISIPNASSKFGNKQIPAYVKQGFPNVFNDSTALNRTSNTRALTKFNQSMLPKVPGINENYGMIYNKPETEAERTMNELWMARRRQEAFEWKTQQHLALVMDRLALHKSRLESDALRRQESTAAISSKSSKPRPMSAPISNPHNQAVCTNNPPLRVKTAAVNTIDTTTTSGGGMIGARMLRRAIVEENALSPRSPRSPTRTPSRRARLRQYAAENSDSEHSITTSDTNHHQPPQDNNSIKNLDEAHSANIVLNMNGEQSISTVVRPSRVSVSKPNTVSHLPMRFKMDLPEDYTAQQRVYMQLSDSDDDDLPDRPIKNLKQSKTSNKTTTTSTKKNAPTATTSGGNVSVSVTFKHERPVDRERPISAKLFHNVSSNDPEFKVHYRHTNYRRMPLTEKQEIWLDEQEVNRIKTSEEVAKKLVDAVAAKADKKKDKGGSGDKDKKDKKDKKEKPDKKTATLSEEVVKIKPKYKSAAQFMATQFPNFEDDENIETQAPMRTIQLLEVAEIIDVCEKYNVKIKESVLRKALIIPQDRPEAICLENLRTEKEGLMMNPNPPEMWRKIISAGKKGKKGKKKKK